MISDDTLFVRPAEAAKLLSMSRSKVYQLIQRGELPSRRFGASLRIPFPALRLLAETKPSGDTSIRSLEK
jgi:excisionase family DNA binding protein